MLHLAAVVGSHLYHNGGVLGKEYLHGVALVEAVEVDVESALGVGKGHLEQGGEQAAGAHVVGGEQHLAGHKLLHGGKGCGKVLCALHTGGFLSYGAQGLVQGRATQLKRCAREINVVEVAFLELQHGAHSLFHVAHLAGCRDDDGARGEHFLAPIGLCHREAVFASGNVDAQGDGKVGAGLHGTVQGGVLALIAAGPHPVGAQRHSLKAAGKVGAGKVGECLGYREHTAGRRVDEASLRGVAYRGGNAAGAGVVEGHHATVAQGQLQLALALLAGHFARHRTVDLVGEPVFAGHGLKLEHGGNVAVELRDAGCGILVVVHLGYVGHHGLGRAAKHVVHAQVDGLHAVGLLKDEAVVAGALAHYIEGGALALCYLVNVVEVFLMSHKAHALLRLVAYDFFRREGGVAHGQLAHVDVAASVFYQFREGVEMAASPVVVYRHDGIALVLAHGAYHVGHTLLHLGIGTLHGVELDAVVILAGVDAAHGTAAHTYAVVVAAHHHHFLAGLGRALDGIALGGIAHAAGQHDDLVVGPLPVALLVLKGEQRAAHQRLAKLVAEVAGAVGGLDEYLLGCLVQPGAWRHGALLPQALCLGARIAGHVHSCAGQGQAGPAAAQAVAYLAAAARGSPVEGLYRGGEVVGLGLERYHCIYVLHLEVVGTVGVGGSKLLDARTLEEGHIVLVGRYHPVGMLAGGFLDQAEERHRHLLAVDDECAAKYLVTAMLTVDLREAEDLAVGERAPQALGQSLEVVDLLGAQGQSLLLVVAFYVVDIHDGVGGLGHFENVAVEHVVHALQHLVVAWLLVARGGELLDAGDARHGHVLGDLDGVGAPWRDHLAPGSYEGAPQRVVVHSLAAQQPFQFLYFSG